MRKEESKKGCGLDRDLRGELASEIGRASMWETRRQAGDTFVGGGVVWMSVVVRFLIDGIAMESVGLGFMALGSIGTWVGMD